MGYSVMRSSRMHLISPALTSRLNVDVLIPSALAASLGLLQPQMLSLDVVPFKGGRSPQNTQKYVASGWLESVGVGVFKRAGDSPIHLVGERRK
jgi:hypothetical protein